MNLPKARVGATDGCGWTRIFRNLWKAEALLKRCFGGYGQLPFNQCPSSRIRASGFLSALIDCHFYDSRGIQNLSRSDAELNKQNAAKRSHPADPPDFLRSLSAGIKDRKHGPSRLLKGLRIARRQNCGLGNVAARKGKRCHNDAKSAQSFHANETCRQAGYSKEPRAVFIA